MMTSPATDANDNDEPARFRLRRLGLEMKMMVAISASVSSVVKEEKREPSAFSSVPPATPAPGMGLETRQRVRDGRWRGVRTCAPPSPERKPRSATLKTTLHSSAAAAWS